eukprot:scaffold25831_cov90-Isochrysis_galbana.AAC.1
MYTTKSRPCSASSPTSRSRSVVTSPRAAAVDPTAGGGASGAQGSREQVHQHAKGGRVVREGAGVLTVVGLELCKLRANHRVGRLSLPKHVVHLDTQLLGFH